MAIEKIELASALHTRWRTGAPGFQDAYGQFMQRTQDRNLTHLGGHSLLTLALKGGEMLYIPDKHDHVPVAPKTAGSLALSFADARLVSPRKGIVEVSLHSLDDVLCTLGADADEEPAVSVALPLAEAAQNLTVISDDEVAAYLDHIIPPHELVDDALAQANAIARAEAANHEITLRVLKK